MIEGQPIVANNIKSYLRNKPRLFEHPSELAQLFLDYVEYAKNQVWTKQEFLKAGSRAGESVEVKVRTPMTLTGFCMFSGINVRKFKEFLKPETAQIREGYDHPDKIDYLRKMTDVANEIKTCIENQQFEGAMVGAYHAGLTSRSLGLAEKSELTGADGGALSVHAITGMVVK